MIEETEFKLLQAKIDLLKYGAYHISKTLQTQAQINYETDRLFRDLSKILNTFDDRIRNLERIIQLHFLEKENLSQH